MLPPLPAGSQISIEELPGSFRLTFPMTRQMHWARWVVAVVMFRCCLVVAWGFGGHGFILSRDAATAGVTVDTVNVDSVAIEVLRVGERMAPGMIKTLRSETPTYPYNLDQLVDQSARPVWSGTMDTKGARNEVVHTAFPLSQAAEPRQPGVYLIVVANASDLRARAQDKQYLWQRSDVSEFASQIVVQTDIALTTVTAADGLHVFTRSLGTAGPLGGIEVQLQARDSQVLGKATTDDAGHAVLPPGLLRGTGAASANTVVAYGPNQDFAILDVTQAAFDLSDRGVTGRDVQGPLDAFVYTDRGIYRPGEHIPAMALLPHRRGVSIHAGWVPPAPAERHRCRQDAAARRTANGTADSRSL